MEILVLILLASILAVSCQKAASSPCPLTAGGLNRIGDTRFYIVQNPKRGDFTDWYNAGEVCAKNGLKLAKIDNMLTMAMVGRELENFVRANKLRDTWYWVNAKFSEPDEVYEWADTEKSVNYTNYFYRQPRPLGIGTHVSYKGVYDPESFVEQCLAFAMPYPWNKGYGFSTSFDEKPCEGRTKRHAMCESDNPVCKTMDKSAYRLNEEKEDYFYKGNWIIGNRRFIVNWEPRSLNASVKYCDQLGLTVYTPAKDKDICLIPFIKLWSRNVTTSQFWTSWRYNVKSETYLDKSKKVVHTNGEKPITFEWETRTGVYSKDHCVAMIHNYELKDQLPCTDKDSASCVWNTMTYVPANCENKIGTICQHLDINRTCHITGKDLANIPSLLERTATIPFGWARNNATMRSTYKQTFGSLICPPGYRMLRETTMFSKPPNDTAVYQYDLIESFWVIDKDKFNKTSSSLCTISTPKSEDGVDREMKQVPCDSWQFYLCEKLLKPTKKRKAGSSISRPQPMWDSKQYPRGELNPKPKPTG